MEVSEKDEKFAEKTVKIKRFSSQKWKNEYSLHWPVLTKSNLSDSHGFCSACNVHFSVSHGGKADCRKHILSAKHASLSALSYQSKNITNFFVKPGESSGLSLNESTMKAETLYTNFIVEHNLPLSVADHATKIFKEMFPDSDIAKSYSSGRSKSTAIVQELSLMKQEIITSQIQKAPYSLATDGSNDYIYD